MPRIPIPCSECGCPSRPPAGSTKCKPCRAKEHRRVRVYKTCQTCGGRVAAKSRFANCRACRKAMVNKSRRGDISQGRAKKMSSRWATCKMRKCRKRYQLEAHQDPRFTWYCPECRKKMAEITEGVQWLSRLGIEFIIEDGGETEIIQDSLVKAYDERPAQGER